MLDEASIRSILTGDESAPAGIGPDDIAAVAVEGDWGAVVLRREEADRVLLATIHDRLSATFPGTMFEVRAGGRIHRGGDGFGAGRHVLAVLGGKGGVGKPTTTVNLGLTLAALGHRVGILDGDLNAPDIPHLVGLKPEPETPGPGWDLWRSDVRPPSRWR